MLLGEWPGTADRRRGTVNVKPLRRPQRGGPRPQPGARAVAPPATETVEIHGIGGDGDGVARAADGTALFVPLALPGERALVKPMARRGDGWAAAAEQVFSRSPDRVEPSCRHFGECGGCSLQHWRTDAYAAWKAGLLATALRRAGFDPPPVAPLVQGGVAQRRRMDLAVQRRPNGLVVGLHAPRSRHAVDLQECAVLHPALVALLGPLRTLLGRMPAVHREASVVVNLLQNGPDFLLRTDGALDLAERAALTAFAKAYGLGRVSWARGGGEAEPVAVLRPPTVSFAGVAVTPPPGAFLQATEEGEAAIVSAVLSGLPDRLPPRARLADLYAGCGTLTFALAQQGRVSAWEGNPDNAKALQTGANHAGLGGRITAAVRDLTRQPLTAQELAGFAAIVLDPPQAGALSQIGAVAASAVPAVIYVSCNPAALTRDAQVLRGAGYRLHAATPIDQFLWSARLESVCVFRR